jgi:hypothetical protein
MRLTEWIKSLSSTLKIKTAHATKNQSLMNLRDANRSFAIQTELIGENFKNACKSIALSDEVANFSWRHTWSSERNIQDSTHYHSKSVKGRMYAIPVEATPVNSSRYFESRSLGKRL